MPDKEETREVPIGIVIVTHGSFGGTLLEAAELVVGTQEHVRSVGVPRDAMVDQVLVSIRNAVEYCEQGRGVLVLTDLFGGTPTTLSLSLLKSFQMEVITGVNLPMVVKALQTRQLSLEELSGQVKSAGRQGIVVAGEVLKRKVNEGSRGGGGS